MIWHLIKYLVVLIIGAFYKRVQGRNVRNLQVKGPVIIAMNHPNAFTDPSAFTYVSYPQRLKYLARGDAFKPGLAAWLLEQIGIVPIYRLQDGGVEGLKKNDEAYRRVNALLRKNNKIIVFAEGICVQERRLRPLKKGVARMVFGAYESLPHDDLVVVPVGVNYSQPNKFRSTLFYNVGEPIAVKDFMEQYRQNPARANNLFLQTLEPRMRELITHIRDKNYDEVVCQVETLCKRNILKERGLNYKDLASDFEVSKELTEKVNTAVEDNKEVVDEFKAKAKPYFDSLQKHNLKDWLIDPQRNKKVNTANLYWRYLLLALGYPFYAIGMLGNYPSFLLVKKLTKKIVKTPEFYASFFIGLGMFTYIFTYLFWFFIVYAFSPNILAPLLVCLAFALDAWFALLYHPFKLKAAGMRRILKNPKLAAELAEERKILVALINKF